jgi:hypothetical protein
MAIKALTVTEYDNDEPGVPGELLSLPEMTPFELFANGLPPEARSELLKMDGFLLREMKDRLKFKRTIDKSGHMAYAAPCGLNYIIREYGVDNTQRTSWVQNESKPDLTNAVLKRLNETSPAAAGEMFNKMQLCNPHVRDCGQRTVVEYLGGKKDVCSSAANLGMAPAEFETIRKYIAAASEIIR